jgi:hypothetical protein
VLVVVSYRGDANNGAVSSECKAANEASVVTEPTTTSTTEQNVTVAGWDGKLAKHAKATKSQDTDLGRLLTGV